MPISCDSFARRWRGSVRSRIPDMIWTQERKQGFGSPNEFGHCTYNVHFCIALRAILPRCRSSNFGPGEPQAFGCDLLMNGERVVIKSCQRKGKAMSDDDLKAELERLRSENAALKKGASDGIRMKVSEKGAVSVYGMGRFPVTLYKEQWLKLLNMSDEIRAFIAENEARLKAKD